MPHRRGAPAGNALSRPATRSGCPYDVPSVSEPSVRPEASPPFVSVVIPVLNEERHVGRCLTSVAEQQYPHDRLEVIVADGGSTDRTREIVGDFCATHPYARLIDNPRRVQAAGLNAAIRASRGEVIARIDGHAAWPPTHLQRCVDLLAATSADNVGGTMEAVGDTPTGEAIARATRSPFAVGGARYRYARRRQVTDTVWLGCFRRSALERVGLYDERLAVHEDFDLNHRLRASGGRIVFSPDVPAMYWARDTWSALARQYFRYGRAKGGTARGDPALLRPYHLIPPLATALCGMAGPAALLRPGLRRPLTVIGTTYLGACAAASLRAGRGCAPPIRARIPLVFPLVHAAWGSGFWAGLLRGPVHPS